MMLCWSAKPATKKDFIDTGRLLKYLQAVVGNEHFEFGQWIGEARDSNGVVVRIMLNIEERNPGIAQVCNYSPEFPHIRTVGRFAYPKFEREVVIRLEELFFFNESNGALIPAKEYWSSQKIEKPLPKQTRYIFERKDRVLSGNFEVDNGDSGTFKLTNTINDESKPADHRFSWKQFKSFVSDVQCEGLLFRGQGNSQHKLRSTFHRCKRNNLLDYLRSDIPRLRHSINAVSSFYYRDNDLEHLGALLSLAQHHGYPTPLLDWTLSPYIAAYFAFHPCSRMVGGSTRIFVFDRSGWPPPISPRTFYDPLPCITFHEFAAHNNPRFVPQQSVASFSNVDDMEELIRSEERNSGRRHLTPIDIALGEQDAIIRDLRLMGITAASLFPGVAGTCESLRKQYFES